jgi:hypothetical protein
MICLVRFSWNLDLVQYLTGNLLYPRDRTGDGKNVSNLVFSQSLPVIRLRINVLKHCFGYAGNDLGTRIFNPSVDSSAARCQTTFNIRQQGRGNAKAKWKPGSDPTSHKGRLGAGDAVSKLIQEVWPQEWQIDGNDNCHRCGAKAQGSSNSPERTSIGMRVGKFFSAYDPNRGCDRRKQVDHMVQQSLPVPIEQTFVAAHSAAETSGQDEAIDVDALTGLGHSFTMDEPFF